MAMMPDTEAMFRPDEDQKYSCTVVIGETVLFFGGYYLSNQVSQLTPIGLMRIGTLPFGLKEGTCLVMDNQLLLGFETRNKRSCWSRLRFLKSEILNNVFSVLI